MRNVLTIVLILAALALLVYGVWFSRHQVYNTDADNNVSSAAMSEPQLMEQMCYDGITLDEKGNLQIKPREKACST